MDGSDPTERLPAFPPALQGRYRPERLLGSGGMATVWAARSLADDRPVAVKLLSPELARDPVILERFRLESSLAGRHLHEALVQVFEAGDAAGAPFIVCELVDGRTLLQVLSAGGAMRPERALEVVGELARCLGALHEAGIVHRDVKPENLMLDEAGRVRVLDLGLARDAAGGAGLTKTGLILGTADYLAPEVCRGEKAGPPSDVFAAGLVLLACLAPDRLWARGRATGTEQLATRAAGKEEHRLPPGLPSSVAALARRALAFDPADRPADGAALELAVDEALARLHEPPAVRLTESGVTRAMVFPVSGRRDRMTATVQRVEGSSPPRARGHGRPLAALGALALLLAAVVLAWRVGGVVSPPPEAARLDATPTPAPATPVREDPTARRQFLAQLQEFLRTPRPRANDPKLRRPVPPPDPIWLREMVLGQLRDLCTVFDADLDPAGLLAAADRFVGLLDLFLRLPPGPPGEVERTSAALACEAADFVDRATNHYRASVETAVISALGATMRGYSQVAAPSRSGEPTLLTAVGYLREQLAALAAREAAEGRPRKYLDPALLASYRFQASVAPPKELLDGLRPLVSAAREPGCTEPARVLALLALWVEFQRYDMRFMPNLDAMRKVVEEAHVLARPWLGGELPADRRLAIRLHATFLHALLQNTQGLFDDTTGLVEARAYLSRYAAQRYDKTYRAEVIDLFNRFGRRDQAALLSAEFPER